MNLFELAESDLAFTLEDAENGAGVPVVLINKNGDRFGDDGSLIAQTTDIGFFIDPGSGVGVRGRNVEVNFRLSTLMRICAAIPDKDGWLIESTDVGGNKGTFAVEELMVDRKIGVVKMTVGVVDVS